MTIVLFLVCGFLTGFVARALLPGTASMTIPAMTAVSLFGASIGGAVGNAAFAGSLLVLHPAGIVGSVVGALITMGLVSLKLTREEQLGTARA